MPKTRTQEKAENVGDERDVEQAEENVGDKRDVENVEKTNQEEPPQKKTKTESNQHSQHTYLTGTIERGHIYFFYRPKVQLEQAHSVDEVKNFHMLLVPRPPDFSVTHSGTTKKDSDSDSNSDDDDDDAEMNLVSSGSDAIPAPATKNQSKKHFRLITIGKKTLPDPSSGGSGKGQKETFWATVTSVGEDLNKLQEGLGEKEYETKTRGMRHQESARLVARGAYAIVNNNPSTPSKRTTHLGYAISHPTSLEDVQQSLGIQKSASFVVQIKNPLAPATGPQQVHSKGAEYPEWIMRDVFGKGGGRGREEYGLRFASCETGELLDYNGAELLLIAARGGEEGLETSLGEGRGEALQEKEEEESNEGIKEILKELNMDASKIPAEPIEGIWV